MSGETKLLLARRKKKRYFFDVLVEEDGCSFCDKVIDELRRPKPLRRRSRGQHVHDRPAGTTAPERKKRYKYQSPE
jgi:hypothetical protein